MGRRFEGRVVHGCPTRLPQWQLPLSGPHTPAPATAPTQYEYLWADGVKIKKPVRLSAPEYIDKLFDWIESQVSRPATAPEVAGSPEVALTSAGQLPS